MTAWMRDELGVSIANRKVSIDTMLSGGTGGKRELVSEQMTTSGDVAKKQKKVAAASGTAHFSCSELRLERWRTGISL